MSDLFDQIRQLEKSWLDEAIEQRDRAVRALAAVISATTWDGAVREAMTGIREPWAQEVLDDE